MGSKESSYKKTYDKAKQSLFENVELQQQKPEEVKAEIKPRINPLNFRSGGMRI